jgi:branched-chain amino acid aminotransferase
MVWLDGELVDAGSARVSASDHGLTVGDGLFETMKVVNGTAFAITRHLRRLARTAEGLHLTPPPADDLREAIERTVTANAGCGRVRITLTGGPGPAGTDRGDAAATVLVVTSAATVWPPTARVAVVPWTRNERGALAGLKTTSYAENVIALERAHSVGAEEAIFANTQGHLCEGTGTNVFVASGGRLCTPPLTAGCLAGITRELVGEVVAVEEVDLPLSALADAAEAFLTSSTRDVQPIAFVDGKALPVAPGPLTSAAAAAFTKLVATTLDP